MRIHYGNKCYKKFVNHIIKAAKYIYSDNAVSKNDLDIFMGIGESGNFKVSYTHDRFEDDNNITFIAEGKTIQEKQSRMPTYQFGVEAPDDGTYEFVLLRLVDRTGSYQVRFSLPEWKLICEYISKEINIIRNDCMRDAASSKE